MLITFYCKSWIYIGIKPFLKECWVFDVKPTLTNGLLQGLQNRSNKRKIKNYYLEVRKSIFHKK